MLGNSWIAAQLAASQEGISSMELVSPQDSATGPCREPHVSSPYFHGLFTETITIFRIWAYRT
jgi:hypothetical protein